MQFHHPAHKFIFAHDKQKIIRLDGPIRLRTCIQCTLFTMTDGEHIHFMLLPHVKLHQRSADPAFQRVYLRMLYSSDTPIKSTTLVCARRCASLPAHFALRQDNTVTPTRSSTLACTVLLLWQ